MKSDFVTDDKMDFLLREALAPDMEPERATKEAIRMKMAAAREGCLEYNTRNTSAPAIHKRASKGCQLLRRDDMDWSKRRKASVAIVSMICILVASITGVAASRYLSREEIVEGMKDREAKEVYEKGNVLEINQTQEAGGYVFTLYSIASGELLEQCGLNGLSGKDGVKESTYAVLSIARKDGTPMPATSSDEYGELDFFVSPLIQGLEPWNFNMASMGGSYSEMEKDGIWYRVMECDNIVPFANRRLYLCINESQFYRSEAFRYNQEDGTITRNEEYEGINLLFDLPIDPAYGDEQKVAEYLRQWGKE